MKRSRTGTSKNKVINGDSREILEGFESDSIDAIVTDPPYEIGFMGKEWDKSGISFNSEIWEKCLRVLKPGGHLLAFGGTRTYHRIAVAIEDAGFEIRDSIAWIYGSGFPKSLNISKQIDSRGGENISWFGEWLRDWRVKNNITQKEISKLFPSKTGGLTGCVANWELGLNLPTAEQFSTIVRSFNLPFGTIEEAEREVTGKQRQGKLAVAPGQDNDRSSIMLDITASATEAAKKWEGWGTALKPALEPICLARKPLSEKTVAANVLEWGTGALNIDGSRIEAEKETGWGGGGSKLYDGGLSRNGGKSRPADGRWPANLIHDGSEEVEREFPSPHGAGQSRFGTRDIGGESKGIFPAHGKGGHRFGDEGSASRFFYTAKASKWERESHNKHPTVKPVALMEYLVKLVTLRGGMVLDPFAGSGSTLIAAKRLGYRYIGIERNSEHVETIKKRLKRAAHEPELFEGTV